MRPSKKYEFKGQSKTVIEWSEETGIGKGSYALEHRIKIARHLGRLLLESETVHHINGDRSDNCLSNLQLRIGRHGKGQAYCCAECGSSNLRPIEL